MKAKVIIGIVIVAVIIIVGVLLKSNYLIIDTVRSYDKAIITLPDGKVIKGDVESWKDYEGEQLQVKIDGTIYLVNSNDCVLIAE